MALFLGCLAPHSAQAAFGFQKVEIAFSDEGGSPVTQAGAHPFAWSTSFSFNTKLVSGSLELPDEELRDLRIQLPPGLIGTPALLPRCDRNEFLVEACSPDTAVGEVALHTSYSGTEGAKFPVYNLLPRPGVAAEFAFLAAEVPVSIEVRIKPAPPYNLVADISYASQAAALFGVELTIYGAPGGRPFLTLPRSCSGSLATVFEADSWQQPGSWTPPAVAEPPGAPGMSGCGELGFESRVDLRPTSAAARDSSGLDLSLDSADQGLTSASDIAESDIAGAVLALPAGMTVNASVAEGLGACGPADYARETLDSPSGGGCPETSKIGTVMVESPLLEEPVGGTVFVAQPDDPATAVPGAENPFDSLLSLYVVFRDAKLGVLIKQAIEVEADAATGRLTGRIDGIPQLPFSRLKLHLREGARAPLTTPPACGTHGAGYELTPSSGAAPLRGQSSFSLDQGCAAAGFAPSVSAGTVTPRAGAASPFVLDLGRADAEQGLSRLTVALPPGLSANFGSVPLCPSALAATGACSAASRIGSARVAAGTGPIPVWIPRPANPAGSVYLAGPYEGAPFSLVVAVPARAGPFDLGTVVVRAAVLVDRRTARAKVRLDPLPQIIDGIPISYRAVHLVLDRPGFVFNPTSCAASAVDASIGSATGATATASNRFQARDCAALGFRPKVSLRLLGPTRRGAHPRLRTVLTPRPGDANIARAAVTLPGTELLDNRHIGTTCTPAQFAAERCPAGSISGYAKAWTPMLDRPLAGPVYLRASGRRLPELAASLDGQLRLDLTARVDSVAGRLRNTLLAVPDVPLSRVVLTMRGGRRGLLVNTGGLCGHGRRAGAALGAQNGRRHDISLVVRADCPQRRR